jgi:uncharacterized protein
MTTNYWPWWLGGLALAMVAITFPLLVGAPLGVSGAMARLLRWRREDRDGSPGCGPSTTEKGTESPKPPASEALFADEDACGTPACLPGSAATRGPDRVANLIFLLGMLIGGGLAGWAGGQTWSQARLSQEFDRLFGNGLSSVLVLFGGGILVGFGTRWSGGCTSGHGLSGCGRLQPASLMATAVFFGVAIAVSFLLERLLS